jgi:hypothetical protein
MPDQESQLHETVKTHGLGQQVQTSFPSSHSVDARPSPSPLPVRLSPLRSVRGNVRCWLAVGQRERPPEHTTDRRKGNNSLLCIRQLVPLHAAALANGRSVDFPRSRTSECPVLRARRPCVSHRPLRDTPLNRPRATNGQQPRGSNAEGQRAGRTAARDVKRRASEACCCSVCVRCTLAFS